MRISREVAINEVYLNEQARAFAWERVPAKTWANEAGKALVWIVGVCLLILLMVLLTPSPSKADSMPFSIAGVASYLDSYTPLPLADGVDEALALNLLTAQRARWGSAPKSWQVGSLLASETSVLKAIGVYVYPDGPDFVTFDTDFFWLIWAQSEVAINVDASGGFDRVAFDFGPVAVATPEPATWLALAVGLFGLAIVANVYRKGLRP
jgi:hypothetical protein